MNAPLIDAGLADWTVNHITERISLLGVSNHFQSFPKEPSHFMLADLVRYCNDPYRKPSIAG
jgi:hypothetical protein